MSQHEDLPVFRDWLAFIPRLFAITEKFPQKARFTFSARLENWALEILEKIIEARDARREQKGEILRAINLLIEKLRIFSRICQEQKFMSNNAYEAISRELHNVGTQIGGWLKEVQNP
jgi:hypothetical protein